MGTYYPAFRCRDCGATWSATYRATRYFKEEPRTQLERIEQAHTAYPEKRGHRIVKVKAQR